MKTRRNLSVAATESASPPRFDPSTWANQARLLARNEAEAARAAIKDDADTANP